MFPPDVALPIGGIDTPSIILLETHFDNPTLQTGIEHFLHPLNYRLIEFFLAGVVDNSGFRFTYTSIPPVHQAGAIGLGFPIAPGLIIPPDIPDFGITAFCSKECTQAVSFLFVVNYIDVASNQRCSLDTFPLNLNHAWPGLRLLVMVATSFFLL